MRPNEEFDIQACLWSGKTWIMEFVDYICAKRQSEMICLYSLFIVSVVSVISVQPTTEKPTTMKPTTSLSTTLSDTTPTTRMTTMNNGNVL